MRLLKLLCFYNVLCFDFVHPSLICFSHIHKEAAHLWIGNWFKGRGRISFVNTQIDGYIFKWRFQLIANHLHWIFAKKTVLICQYAKYLRRINSPILSHRIDHFNYFCLFQLNRINKNDNNNRFGIWFSWLKHVVGLLLLWLFLFFFLFKYKTKCIWLNTYHNASESISISFELQCCFCWDIKFSIV